MANKTHFRVAHPYVEKLYIVHVIRPKISCLALSAPIINATNYGRYDNRSADKNIGLREHRYYIR